MRGRGGLFGSTSFTEAVVSIFMFDCLVSNLVSFFSLASWLSGWFSTLVQTERFFKNAISTDPNDPLTFP